jgi:Sugar-transfer associated ATP-grasp
VRAREAALRLRTLASVSRTASEGYGISRLSAARTAMRLRRRNGFDVDGALLDGLLDPAMDDRVRYAHIGRTMRRAAQDRLNPVSLEPFSEQKLLSYDYLRACGLAVPAVHGAVGPAGGWSRASGAFFTGRDGFAAFLDGLPGDIVLKPSFGNRGAQVRVLARGAGGFADLRGAPVDLGAVHDEIAAGAPGDLQLVQERLRNHPEVEEISGSPVLRTLRLITIVRPDGSVLIHTGVLKLALGRADTDNFSNGATGNGYALVSLDDGRLRELTTRAPAGYGLATSPTVPATGVQVLGRPVPLFEEACDLVRRASTLMLPMRTLGWDVALTPGGPVLLEANNWWAPFEPLSDEGWGLMVGRR